MPSRQYHPIKAMIKILKYSFYDLMRSRWSYVYFLFYLLLGFVLLFLNNDLSKAVITLMNVIIVLVPLIGTIFGVMYFYNSKEFTELLLAQPIKRSSIFIGQYLGVAGSLSMSLVLGLGIPFVIYGLFESNAIWDFSLLLITGAFLTLIFTALSFNIALSNENKIKGFGYAVLMWLFLAVIYDGLFLMSLIVFEQYPLDSFSLAATMFNPIDLSRTLILLKLDISALLGYTGAVFKQFFGTYIGVVISFVMLGFWTLIPILRLSFKAKRKDF
ncbi:Cu-processing system permease protein [Arenibacter nanhaiticus]|uniref:Cu-processing system permease protein n=2 Tax=Arenibacter nanhaiticus TaxID=558155 RepID=A0A1M6GYH4_9FLAO|nr:Cu-processing system permease protein [Arenibacter nanhaiticus]